MSAGAVPKFCPSTSGYGTGAPMMFAYSAARAFMRAIALSGFDIAGLDPPSIFLSASKRSSSSIRQ